MSYHIGSQNIVAIPIYVRHNITFREAGGGRLDITVGPKQTIGRTVSTRVQFLYSFCLCMLQVFTIFSVYCTLQYFGTEGAVLYFYANFTLLYSPSVYPTYLKVFSYESCSILLFLAYVHST